METFTTDNNGMAQSADGSLIWLLHQHYLQEQQQEEEAEFLDEASGDGQDEEDDVAYPSDLEFGYPTDEETVQGYNFFDSVMIFHLLARLLEVDFETVRELLREVGAHGGGGLLGAGVVPASDAAVAGLEKQSFHATEKGCDVTGCAICLEDFLDGEEVTVMPCSRGHEFHPVCITKWLGKSNMCPLCRQALPTVVVDADGL